MIKNKSFSSLRCFTEVEKSPYKMWIKNKKSATPFVKSKKEYHSLSRQELPKVYRHLAYLDIINPSKTIEKNSMVGRRVYFFNLDSKKYYITDIDTKEDLVVSESEKKKKFLKYY